MSGNLASTFSLDVSNFIASMQQAGTVTQTQADKMQRTLNALNKQIGDLAKSTKQTAANADAYDTLAQGAEHAARSHAGLNREILVLAHEASQGNWKRLAGSLMVFGEYASSIGVGALASAAGVAGLVAAVGVLGLKIAQGAMESDKFNKSLILTGNYAGMTADRLTEMARAAAASTNSTIGESRGVFAGLTASGAFGPGQIGAAGQDVLLLERVTGQSAEEIVKDFAKMSEGVTRWAAEHNRSMHFITAGQYDYIRQLEEQGKTEQAEQVVLDALKDHLDGVNQNLGLMARAWLGAKQAASSFFDAVAGIGRQETIDEQLKEARYRQMRLHVATFTNQSALGTGDWFASPGALERARADQDALVAKLEEQQATAKRLAAEQADQARRQQEGIKGSDVVKQITEEVDKRSMAIRKVEEYTAAVKKMREAGDPNAPSPAQEAETIKRINERFQNRDTRAGENYLKQLQRQVEAAEKGKDAMLYLEAEQKGVAAAAAPWIDRLREGELRAQRIQRVIADTAEAEAQAAKVDALTTAGNDLTKSYIEQAQVIGMNADQLERLTLDRKLDAELQKAMVGASADTVAKLYEQDAKNRANAMAQLDNLQRARKEYNANPMNGVDSAFDKWMQDVQNQAKQAEDLTTGLLNQASDAFVHFAQTGKLNLGSLFQYWEEQVLRIEANKLMMSLFDSTSNNGIGTMLFDFFSGGAFQHATGADYIPYNGYPAILHEGEAVLTKQQNLARSGGGGGSGGIHIGQGMTVNIGQGVSRAEVTAGINQALGYQEARFRRLMRQERLQ